jgi:Uma2 family endonuclease
MNDMGGTTTRLTFGEFERLPDQPGKRELLKGELIGLPPADFVHNEIAHRIFNQLDAAVLEAHSSGEAAQLGSAYHEMGYQLPDDGYVQPDVSVTHAGQPRETYLSGAPAIAIEVVSPSNSAMELDAKTHLYFQFGSYEVWIVYTKTRHVDIHVPGGSRVVAADQSVTTPLLPAFSMPVTEVLGESDTNLV